MKVRCDNYMWERYHKYGGAGITYTKLWAFYDNFLADMGERPLNKTLERKDSGGNYTKENCVWATKTEQGINRSTTKLTVELVKRIRERAAQETVTHSVLSAEYGVSRPTISLLLAGKTWNLYEVCDGESIGLGPTRSSSVD